MCVDPLFNPGFLRYYSIFQSSKHVRLGRRDPFQYLLVSTLGAYSVHGGYLLAFEWIGLILSPAERHSNIK